MGAELTSAEAVLFEAFPHPVWIYDVATLEIVAANQAVERVYGYRPDQLIGCSVAVLRHPDEVAAWERRLAQARTSPDEPLVTRWRARRSDGGSLHVDVHSMPVQWQGRQARIVVSRDVTSTVEVARRLRLIEAAMDQAGDAVMITDTANPPRIVYVNAEFERLSGVPAHDAIGSTPFAFRHADTDPATIGRLLRAYQAQEPITAELQMRRHDGSGLWVDISITPLADEDGDITHWVAIQRDLTERRRAQAEMVESSRIEAVARLAAGVAHDFNNLLTVIASSAELARWDLPAGHPATAHIGDIETAAERARGHTGQLLAVSRREPVRTAPIDLGAAVTAALPGLRRVAGPTIRVRAEVAPGRMARIDPGQLEQALLSLVANARDAQPSGGEVRITITDGQEGQVEVCVEDDGPGVDEEHAEQAFEPFWSTKPRGSGAGLGLPTVRWIVARCGGSARVERAASGGARLIMVLPEAGGPVEPC